MKAYASSHKLRLLTRRLSHVSFQIVPKIHNRKARSDNERGNPPPAGLGAVEIVGIPGDGRVKPLGGVEFHQDLTAVLENGGVLIIENRGVDVGPSVAIHAVDPDGVDAKFAVLRFLRNVLVHSPGAIEAEGSGGRENNDEVRVAHADVEARFEIGDEFEVYGLHARRGLPARAERTAWGEKLALFPRPHRPASAHRRGTPRREGVR